MNNLFNKLLLFCRQQRMKLIAGMLCLLVLDIAMIIVEKPSIDSDLARRTSETLDKKGFKRINVGVDGREVFLNGAVSSMSAQSNALLYTGDVYGVRTVTSNLELIPLRLPHIRFSRSQNNVLKLEGEVPTENLAAQILQLAVSTLSHDSIVNLLHANPEVTDPDWIDAVEGVTVEGNHVSGLEIEIGAGRVSVGGLIQKQSDYNVLIQRIHQFAKDQNLVFVNKVGIKPEFSYMAKANPDQSAEDLVSTDENLIVNSATIADKYDEAAHSAEKVPDQSFSDQNQENYLEDFGQERPVEDFAPDPGSANEAVAIVTNDGKTTESKIIKADDGSAAGVEDNGPVIEEKLPGDQSASTATVAKVPGQGFAQELLQELAQELKRGDCQNRLNQSLEAEPITFPSESAEISVDNYTNIKKIADIVTICPTFYVYVSGYTDSRGDLAANLKLSTQRAEAVMLALIDLGIALNRISARGFGASRPVASNDTEEGRQRNRRIEISLTRE